MGTRRARVSIITPALNRQSLISQTIESVLEQTYSDWEQLVVDDGSKDRTREVVAKYERLDPRIRLITTAAGPKGACFCRNLAVDICSGDFLIFLDTDDILEPFCLEQRMRVMRGRPELDFAIFPGTVFEDHPHDLQLWWNVDKPMDELTRQFHQDAICQGTGVIWRKSAFESIGRWDESLAIWQDIDLFFRAYIQDYKFEKFFDHPPDLHNRRNAASLSRCGFFAPEKTQSRIKVIKRAVGLLNREGKTEYLPEARFMVAEIAAGMARSGDLLGGMGLIAWALESQVLTSAEGRRLRRIALLRASRIARLAPIARWVARMEADFQSESTLGTIRYASPHEVPVIPQMYREGAS